MSENEKPESQKQRHSQVRYMTITNKQGQQCSNCSMFIETSPARCTDVVEPIYWGGWCKLWAKKSK